MCKAKGATKIIKISTVLGLLVVLLIAADTRADNQEIKTAEFISVQRELPEHLFGLTIDESSMDEEKWHTSSDQLIKNIVGELRQIRESQVDNKSLTVRIVLPVECKSENTNGDCVEYDPTKVTDTYLKLFKKIHGETESERIALVMAEVMDSDEQISSKCFLKGNGMPIKRINDKKYEKADPQLSKQCYENRVHSLYEKLNKYVDIWEVGNEINGDWFGGKQEDDNNLDQNRRNIVWSQIEAGYKFLKDKTQTAITYYFNDAGDDYFNNKPCDKDDEYTRKSLTRCADSMIDWMNTGSQKFHDVDYVFISYYPDNNFYKVRNPERALPIELKTDDWIKILGLTQKYNLKTKIGLGEMGTHCNFANCGDKNSCEPINVSYGCCRSGGCCPAKQVEIIQTDYQSVDKNIRRALTDVELKRRFVGGYFYWYYSPDVINKAAFGNDEEKKQAENTRYALKVAYRNWNQPIEVAKDMNLMQEANRLTNSPQIKILQEGDIGKTNPYTIVILNNPVIRTNGGLERDPINNAHAKFDKSVAYIYANLFAQMPNQAEKILMDKTLVDKIRVISMWVDKFDDNDANCLVELDGQFEARQTSITDFFKKLNGENPSININPDIVFAVTGWEHKYKATAFAARESDCQRGIKFWFDKKDYKHCFTSDQPGAVAINAEDDSMTALHEFSHAASSYDNGYVDDLSYKEFSCGDCFTINKKRKGWFNKPKEFAVYYLDGADPNDAKNHYALDKSDTRMERGIFAPLKNDSEFPALMDDYHEAKEGHSEKCQHDRLTRQFLLDRIRAKTMR